MKNLIGLFIVSLIVAACGKPVVGPNLSNQCKSELVAQYRSLQQEALRAAFQSNNDAAISALTATKNKVAEFKKANARVACQMQMNEGDKRFKAVRIVNLADELTVKLDNQIAARQNAKAAKKQINLKNIL